MIVGFESEILSKILIFLLDQCLPICFDYDSQWDFFHNDQYTHTYVNITTELTHYVCISWNCVKCGDPHKSHPKQNWKFILYDAVYDTYTQHVCVCMCVWCYIWYTLIFTIGILKNAVVIH